MRIYYQWRFSREVSTIESRIVKSYGRKHIKKIGKVTGRSRGQTKIGTENSYRRDAAATVWRSPPSRWPFPFVGHANNFSSSMLPRVSFFLPSFLSFLFFFFCFQKIVFPATRAHKTKSVLHAYAGGRNGVGLLCGSLHGHFDRANCLNPLVLFAMLCAVPRRHSPLSSATTRSRSQLSFNSVATLPSYTVTVAFGAVVPCRNYVYFYNVVE